METVIQLEAPHGAPARASLLWRLFRKDFLPKTRRLHTPRKPLRDSANARTLDDLAKGESGTIARIQGTTSVRLHLMEMGLTPGTKITVGRVAVLGGPFDVTVRGYRLTLRREEARAIELRPE